MTLSSTQINESGRDLPAKNRDWADSQRHSAVQPEQRIAANNAAPAGIPSKTTPADCRIPIPCINIWWPTLRKKDSNGPQISQPLIKHDYIAWEQYCS